MTQQHAHPSELRLVAAGERLEIDWDDGASTSLSAGGLRAASRSAGAVRAKIDGGGALAQAAVTITGAEPIGAYAVRLFFSDGHDRGVFPWGYLRELGAA